MSSRFMLAALGTVLALAAGCSDATPPVAPPAPPTTPPTTTPPAAPAPPAAPPQDSSSWPSAPAFPALARPGEIYTAADSVYDSAETVAYHGSRLASRYVFYSDGTFELQFSSVNAGFFAYAGRYERLDTRIGFEWDAWSPVGPWEATGTFRGDSLYLAYNAVMHMDDFVDGVYVRASTTP